MNNEHLKQIDTSLGLMVEFSKVAKGTVQKIQSMRQDIIFSDGLFPAKIKALAATLWSINAKCEPCLKFYVLKAKEFGTTEAELGEILAIASTMGGCVGEMWALKAYAAFKSQEIVSDDCCEH